MIASCAIATPSNRAFSFVSARRMRSRMKSGTFTPGTAQEVVLTIESPPTHPIKVTSVSSTSPEVTAKLTTLKEGQSYEVRCSVAPTKQTGRITGKLIIETSDPEEAKRELPLIGFLKS